MFVRTIFAAISFFLVATDCHAASGIASYYGGKGERLARHTANGEVFRPDAHTCAHRSLPFGTRLRVCLKERCTQVRVTDRGPAAYTGRSLDLSYGAARALGMISRGVARVSYNIM